MNSNTNQPEEKQCNYIKKRHYKEPINKCNEYSSYGVKHSYKYICHDDGSGGRRKVKKRKWKNKKSCDKHGDVYDEEEDEQDVEECASLRTSMSSWCRPTVLEMAIIGSRPRLSCKRVLRTTMIRIVSILHFRIVCYLCLCVMYYVH